jgi:hypothetical protein
MARDDGLVAPRLFRSDPVNEKGPGVLSVTPDPSCMLEGIGRCHKMSSPHDRETWTAAIRPPD